MTNLKKKFLGLPPTGDSYFPPLLVQAMRQRRRYSKKQAHEVLSMLSAIEHSLTNSEDPVKETLRVLDRIHDHLRND